MKTGKKTAVVTAVLLLVALLSTNIGAAGGGHPENRAHGGAQGLGIINSRRWMRRRNILNHTKRIMWTNSTVMTAKIRSCI